MHVCVCVFIYERERERTFGVGVGVGVGGKIKALIICNCVLRGVGTEKGVRIEAPVTYTRQILVCMSCNSLKYPWEPKLTECLSSQFGQGQQVQPQQQVSNVSMGSEREFQTAPQGNQQQLQSGGTQEEDADPQKRLQATLQLAAALLQQIQQGKGN